MKINTLPFIYLKPNEVYIAPTPSIIETVLGSCVSVTMFNRRSRIGMISHCLLPKCKNEGACNGDCSEGFKYVDCSICRMIEKYASYDIKRGDIEIKMFGGADMFTIIRSVSVGKQNISTALKTIKTEGLSLVASDVGGTRGRKIFFNTYTGEVLLKRLK